jgi:putative ABC transport system ATP-binding protein
MRLKNNSHIRAGDEDVYRLMEDFELDPALSRNQIGDLSGGERQRVAIVISLLLKREVYLLDEVTSALDKPLKKKVADHFLGREDLTALIVSHDPVWLEYPSVEIFDLEDQQWKP